MAEDFSDGATNKDELSLWMAWIDLPAPGTGGRGERGPKYPVSAGVCM